MQMSCIGEAEMKPTEAKQFDFFKKAPQLVERHMGNGEDA
jgi:hypothetical protein